MKVLNLNKRYCKNKDPNTFDQPIALPNGKLTENGMNSTEISHFFKDGLKDPEKIRVYQKIKLWNVDYSKAFSNIDGF